MLFRDVEESILKAEVQIHTWLPVKITKSWTQNIVLY